LQGYLDSVKALIDGGVNVNASARHGKTALMLAKTPEIADLLRAAGARK
jgi:ankyrin repeat protein